MNITTILVDDDADSRLVASTYIRKYFPEINIAGEATSIKEGIELISKVKPELVLLDIEMPDGTGFDLLRNIDEKNFEVIFITAFNAYAIQAFRFSAIDYLLKPLSLDDLKEALFKVKEKIQLQLFEKHWSSLAYN